MFNVGLFMESGLYLFYVAMAAYGAYSWKFADSATQTKQLAVRCWPLSWHAVAVLGIALVSGMSGWLLSAWTNAAIPYIDSATTWAAIWATFLIARKVLENWWYWLAIDFASFVIYWERELQLSALLFAIYIVMIPFGYLSWRRSMTAE